MGHRFWVPLQYLYGWGGQGTRNVLRMSSMLSYATPYAQFLHTVEGTPQIDQTNYLRSRRCR